MIFITLKLSFILKCYDPCLYMNIPEGINQISYRAETTGQHTQTFNILHLWRTCFFFNFNVPFHPPPPPPPSTAASPVVQSQKNLITSFPIYLILKPKFTGRYFLLNTHLVRTQVISRLVQKQQIGRSKRHWRGHFICYMILLHGEQISPK